MWKICGQAILCSSVNLRTAIDDQAVEHPVQPGWKGGIVLIQMGEVGGTVGIEVVAARLQRLGDARIRILLAGDNQPA